MLTPKLPQAILRLRLVLLPFTTPSTQQQPPNIGQRQGPRPYHTLSKELPNRRFQ